jgi:hypothetical protein
MCRLSGRYETPTSMAAGSDLNDGVDFCVTVHQRCNSAYFGILHTLAPWSSQSSADEPSQTISWSGRSSRFLENTIDIYQ